MSIRNYSKAKNQPEEKGLKSYINDKETETIYI